MYIQPVYSVQCSKYERNKEFLFFKYKTFASERSPWQQHGVNSSVRLPNHYIHAKLEKVLAIHPKMFIILYI